MRLTITKESHVLATSIDSDSLVSVENGTHWKDYHCECPICLQELSINCAMLTIQDDNSPQWQGNCPNCNGLLNVWQPY